MVSQKNASSYVAITGFKKQPPVVICKKGNLNISQISRENTSEICEIFNNAYSEKHTAACIGRLFRKVSKCKAHDIHHA